MRELPVDGPHYGVRLGADEHRAQQVLALQRLEFPEQDGPAVFPAFNQAGARVVWPDLKLGVSLPLQLLPVGGQKLFPARVQVPCDVF